MATSERLIEQYYFRHKQQIIDCPFQPGNLKISEKACHKRHQAAQKKNLETENIFNFYVHQGLLRCEHCPIVKKSLAHRNRDRVHRKSGLD